MTDRLLVDDELIALWSDFRPGVRVLIVLDACHSGVSGEARHRSRLKFAKLPTYRDARIRAVPADAFTAVIEAQRDAIIQATARLTDIPKRIQNVPVSVVRVAACRADQVALESGGRGLFTRALIAAWDDGRFRGTYRELVYAAATQVGYFQEPTLDHYGPEVERFLAEAAELR